MKLQTFSISLSKDTLTLRASKGHLMQCPLKGIPEDGSSLSFCIRLSRTQSRALEVSENLSVDFKVVWTIPR